MLQQLPIGRLATELDGSDLRVLRMMSRVRLIQTSWTRNNEDVRLMANIGTERGGFEPP